MPSSRPIGRTRKSPKEETTDARTAELQEPHPLRSALALLHRCPSCCSTSSSPSPPPSITGRTIAILFLWWILMSVVAADRRRPRPPALSRPSGPHHPPRRAPPLRRAAPAEDLARSQALTDGPAHRPALRLRRRTPRPGQAHPRREPHPEADQGVHHQLAARLLPRLRLVNIPLIPLLLLHRRQILRRLLRRAFAPAAIASSSASSTDFAIRVASPHT